MTISIFDLFSIGIGPSSSHTVGPMRAAQRFVNQLRANHPLTRVTRIYIELFGSLAFTGKGHGTPQAVLLGLENHEPASVDPELARTRIPDIQTSKQLNLGGSHLLAFDLDQDLFFNYKDLLPAHTNGMRFTAFCKEMILEQAVFYSVGGGFIVSEKEIQSANQVDVPIPFPFSDASTLIQLCKQENLSIAELMMQNEKSFRSESDIHARLIEIASIMKACIEKGCQTNGYLPGSLHVKRRAPDLMQKLLQRGKPTSYELTDSMEWLNLYAIAVNEENAAGGRVVTAPTNGAAGIIPAVLHYFLNFYPNQKEKHIHSFLLTAGAIAILYKKGASISGAEVGCQGEVGVACSMAAGALTAVLGGSIAQIENAAEIAMEHHLGLTCDPIHGLVQIPCIERNAMGAVKAVNAARLALLGDGTHYVSLDKVIATMKKTGNDMMSIYKETSLGGLAANFPEC